MAADCETGEPQLDIETGEERDCSVMGFPALVRCREARAIQVTVSTDAETGENEWNTLSKTSITCDPDIQKSNVFHIPQSLLQENFTDASLMGHIFCILSILIFFPAFSAALFICVEVFIHCWYHAFEIKSHKCVDKKDWVHISPFHKFVTAFCQHCQSKRVLNNFGKAQVEKHKISRLNCKAKNLMGMHC